MYKDLFKDQKPKKDDNMAKYKDLFGSEPKPEPKKSYTDLFGSPEPKKEQKPKNSTPMFQRDSRHDAIELLNNSVPSNTVILWLDNFSTELKNISTTNQTLADEQMKLSQDFVKSSEHINLTFSTIKNKIQSVMEPPSTGFLSKFFSSDKKKVFTSDDVTDVIDTIKRTIANTKCNKNIFIKQQLDSVQDKINKIKLHTSCGVVACDYMLSTNPDDDVYLRAKERLLKIGKLNELSEISLNKTHKTLAEDVTKFEDLKDFLIPLLYVKLQGIINQSLDNESMNLINKINQL